MVDRQKIKDHLNNTLDTTDLTGIGHQLKGKVRDVYVNDHEVYLISTDRQSAFDRNLALVPFKGQVLTQTSAWWFEKTRDIVENHVIDVPDPNVVRGRKVDVVPIEFVIRGYLTGSTSTSVWTAYENGEREFCGNILKEGMKKNEPFDDPIITPTTKDDVHDERITPAEMIKRGILAEKDLLYLFEKTKAVFKRGQKIAAENGLILVDTKYEFGRDQEGRFFLCDELHTPDSSRFWLADSYEAELRAGREPKNIDKEFLRLWFKEHCDPYHDEVLPAAPDELVTELAARYIELYEMMTQQDFVYPQENIRHRIAVNLTGKT